MGDTTRLALLRAAEEAREASSIQAAVTAARQVLGVAEAATYTEELAAILHAAYDAAEVGREAITEFLNRLNDAATSGDPVTLWGVDYLPADKATELPLDADGVPIRPGDEMCLADTRSDLPAVCAVDAVGVDTFFAWDCDSARYAQFDAALFRHRKRRTVKDVMADAMDGEHDNPEGIAALIREAYEIGARETAR